MNNETIKICIKYTFVDNKYFTANYLFQFGWRFAAMINIIFETTETRFFLVVVVLIIPISYQQDTNSKLFHNSTKKDALIYGWYYLFTIVSTISWDRISATTTKYECGGEGVWWLRAFFFVSTLMKFIITS